MVIWMMCGVVPFLKPESFIISDYQNATTLIGSHSPDKRALSLSNFPIDIKRMDSGLDGLASHSARRL